MASRVHIQCADCGEKSQERHRNRILTVVSSANSGRPQIEWKHARRHALGWLASRVVAPLVATCALLLSGVCGAETLRVTTWNLGFEAETESAARRVEGAADELRTLDPDVILLQRVTDWHICAQLVEALKPLEYNVLICSAFDRESLLLPARPQVAILSKQKAYFTWADSSLSHNQLEHSDGIVFAAIRSDSRCLGFFSALFIDRAPGQESAERLLAEIKSISQWETNQVQTFIIGASFDPVSPQSAKGLHEVTLALEHAGLVDASERLLDDALATHRMSRAGTGAVADCLFAGPMGFPSNTHITTSRGSEHYPVTCDIELDPDKVTTALDIRAEERREKQAQADTALRKVAYAIGATLIVGAAILARRRRAAKKKPRVTPPERNRLPVRVLPNKTPSQLRPVIFAQLPPATSSSKLPTSPEAPRPVLRVQPSSLRPPKPASESEPIQSRPTKDEPERATHAENPPYAPKAVLGEDSVDSAAINDPAVREGIIKELSGWLKRKFVRRLVTDRSQLIEAQQIATRMANTLDGRLARIEAQIQQQNQAYVRRIEELNQQLAAAREENRELIRERIAQVKAEMEASRVRLLAEANLDNTSFRL